MRTSILALAILPLGGCFSLFSFGGGGGGKSAPLEPKLDGRLFGTGTLTLDTWDLELKVAPESVFVTDDGARLHVQNTQGKQIDVNGGTWSLDVYRKEPGDDMRKAIDRAVKSVDGHAARDVVKMEFLDLGFDGLDAIMTSADNLVAFVYVGEHAGCIYEFVTVTRDAESSVTVWNSARAGIVAIGGGTPESTACQ